MTILPLLTRIFVWAALGFLIYWVLLKFIPRNFLTWFGGAIILALIVLSFIDPNDQTIGTIWRFLSLPLTPLGISILLLFFSITPKGIKAPNGRYVLVALLILALSSLPLVARTLVNQAEQAVQQAYDNQRTLCGDICTVGEVPIDLVQAVVVVGDNIDAVSMPDTLFSRVDNRNTLDPGLMARLDSAGIAYNELPNPPLVFPTMGALSGSNDDKRDKEEPILARLGRQGVALENIIMLNTGRDIHTTITRVKDELQKRDRYRKGEDESRRDDSRVVLVAPALSMRRAALAFEKADLQVVAWPTDLYGIKAEGRDTLARLADLVPSAEALRLTTWYWEEFLTSIYYFLRGWLPSFNVRWDGIVETFPQ